MDFKQSYFKHTSEVVVEPVSSNGLNTPSELDTEKASPTNVNAAGRPWATGFKQNFPKLSFVAILLILGCVGGTIAVLVDSNGKNTNEWCARPVKFGLHAFGHSLAVDSTWSIPPNVWLSIFVFISGKAMAVAFAEAATIAWWTNAMNGRTLKQLHHDWAAAKSIGAVLQSPRLFSWICLGSVFFTIFAGLGTVLQKSTSTQIETGTFFQPMNATLADNMPLYWSGYITGSGGDGVGMITPDFGQVAVDYQANTPIMLNVDGCASQANCSLTIPGIGFEWSCAGAQGFVNMTEAQTTCTKQWNVMTLGVISGFGSTLTNVTLPKSSLPSVSSYDVNQIVLEGFWKDQTGCAGDVMYVQKCTLIPALVEYPITITSGIASLGPATSNITWTTSSEGLDSPKTDMVVKPLAMNSTADGLYLQPGDRTTISGLVKVFSELFSSSVTCSCLVGSCTPTGFFATIIGANSKKFTADDTDCTVLFDNPTALIMSNIRNFMFRSSVAIAAQNMSDYTSNGVGGYVPTGNVPTVSSTDSNASFTIAYTVYKTDFLYLGLGVGLMVVAVAAVLPLFWGFWRLGRKVSLSPIEMAKALHISAEDVKDESGGVRNISVLDATSGQEGATNMPADELLNVLGNVKVQYGEVANGKLGLGIADEVVPIKAGEVYK